MDQITVSSTFSSGCKFCEKVPFISYETDVKQPEKPKINTELVIITESTYKNTHVSHVGKNLNRNFLSSTQKLKNLKIDVTQLVACASQNV